MIHESQEVWFAVCRFRRSSATLGPDTLRGRFHEFLESQNSATDEKGSIVAHEGEPVSIQAVFRQVNVANGLR